MLRKKNKNTLYCFSPLVMVVTIVIELALVLWVLFRHKNSALKRVVVLTLVFLAAFQFVEFQVCTGGFISSDVWSRIGFVAITFLPVFGVQLVSTVAKKNNTQLLAALYVVAGIFSLYFLTMPAIFEQNICTGNYIFFQLNKTFALVYSLYYNASLLIGLYLAFSYYKTTKTRQIRAIYAWFALGYGIFLLPTALIYIVRPEVAESVPSVMCGFAIFYALILAFKIMPLAQNTKKTK